MYGRQRPHSQSGSDRGSSGRRSSRATTTCAGRSTAPTARSRVGVGREFADVDRSVARPSSLESQSPRGTRCASPPPGTAATHGRRVTQSGELNEVDRPPTHPGSRWRACTTFAWQCPERGEPDGPPSSLIEACALQSNSTCSRVVDTPDGPEPGSSSTRGGSTMHRSPREAKLLRLRLLCAHGGHHWIDETLPVHEVSLIGRRCARCGKWETRAVGPPLAKDAVG